MNAKRFRWPAGYKFARSDDNRLVACTGRNLVIVDVEKRVRVSTSLPLSNPYDVCFSPSGRLIAVKSTTGRLATVDPLTGSTVTDFKNQKEGEGCEVHFSPDGEALLDGSWGGTLTMRRASDGAILFRDLYEGEMLSRLSHDKGRRLWLVQHQPVLRLGENVPKPSYISLHHWPIIGETAQAFAYNKRMKSTQISNDGSRFAFVSTGEGRIHIARCADGEIILQSSEIDKAHHVKHICWSDDDSFLCASFSDKFIFLRTVDLSSVGEVPVKYGTSAIWLDGDCEVVLGSSQKSLIVSWPKLLAK